MSDKKNNGQQINPELEKKIDKANSNTHKSWQLLGIIDMILGLILVFAHPRPGIIIMGIGFLCIVLSQAFRPEVQRALRGTGKKKTKK